MTDTKTLTIYGLSDDLLELRGYVHLELPVYGPRTVVLTAPTGAQLAVDAVFGASGSPFVKQGGWELTVRHADSRWTWSVALIKREPPRLGGVSDDPALALEVPEGTTVYALPDPNLTK